MMNEYIGQYVKRFESGNKGSLSISSSGYDWGMSFGSYQLTLRWSNAISFLKKYFPNESKNLYFNKDKEDIKSKTYPGPEYCSSPEDVKSVWVDCYNRVGADTFFEYEHEYIEQNYYVPILNKLKDVFNPNTHSRMAQECLWSWSVHKGASGAYDGFMKACKGIDPQNTPADELIDKLYDVRYSVNKLNRYKKGISANNSEREELRKYCNDSPLPYGDNKKEEPETAPNVERLHYRVQVGAYKVRQYAINQLNTIRNAGFKNVYISYSNTDKYYRVLVGSFININDANRVASFIKAKGFSVVINTVTAK